MTAEEEVQRLLSKLTPDQQNFAKAVAAMKLENRMLSEQVQRMKAQYDDLWKVMIVVLDVQPEKTLRVHESQFLRFREEYRVDRTYDVEKHEVVLRLMTVFDEPVSEG